MADDLRSTASSGYVLQRGNQNSAIINVLITSNNSADREAIFHRYHAILAFIISAILGFLQLRCPTETPFLTHPFPTWTAISALLGYCLVFRHRSTLRLSMRGLRLQLHPRTLMEVLGLLSVVSMVQLMLTPKAWGFFPHFVVALFILAHKIPRWVQARMSRGRVPLLPITLRDLSVNY